MSRQAQLPDGTILEFPDETPDAVIDRTVKAHLGQAAGTFDGVRGSAVTKPDFSNVRSGGSTVPADVGSARRNIMLGARSTLDGVAAIPDFFGAPIRWGIEKATGIPQVGFGDMASAAADKMGLPSPATSHERVMDDVGRAISGSAATIGAGGALPSGSRLGQLLVAQPARQIAGAATGATAAGLSRENGVGPTGQFFAGLVGAMLPGAAPPAAGSLTRLLFRGGEEGRAGMHKAINDFESAGAFPSVGQATGNRRTQGLESLLAGLPPSVGVMASAGERQATAIGAGLQSKADQFFPNASAERAGRAIIEGVRGDRGFIPRTREVANKLYDRVDQTIPADTRVDVDSTKQALADLNASIEGAPNVAKFFQNARIRGIEDALSKDTGGIDAVLSRPGIREQADALRAKLTTEAADQEAAYQQAVRAVEQQNAQARSLGMNNMALLPAKPAIHSKADIDAQVNRALSQLVDNKLPYEALTKLRTLVGNEIDNYSLVDNVPRSKWKALYGALSRDMESAATTPEAKLAWKRANGYYDARIKRLEAIDHVIERNGGPEKVFSAVMSGTRDGGTTLRSVMQSLDTEGQKAVTAAVIKRMGLATPGNQGAAGETFSAQTFLTNWNRVSPEARRTLFDRFGPGFSADMDKIARVAERIRTGSKVFANPSGTTNRAVAISYPLSIAGAAATGRFDVVAALLTGGVAANGLARAMTSRGFVRWLAQQSESPTGANLAALQVIAQRDPDVAEVYESLKARERER
jgi:hypothetical protein